MAEVFCRNCGKQISDIAAFCVGCGVATGVSAIPNVNVSVASKEPKSGGLALLFTILFPGAGHLYIGRTEKGTPFVIANAIGFVCAFTLFLIPISFVIWIVTLIMTAPKISAEVNEVNRLAGFN